MAMNEEQKKAAAERMRKAREAKKAAAEQEKMESMNEAEETKTPEAEQTANAQQEAKPAAPTFTMEDVQKMIAEALAKQAEMMKPQVIQVSQGDQKVLIRFQAEVADDNVAVFGAGGYYGQITGKSGMLTVPKSEFTSRFLDENARWMLKNRWLVVLDGLDEQERELYGVNYRDGEVLDERAFAKLLDMSETEMLGIYPKLCVPYREMVARRFVTRYQNGDHRVKERRSLVKQLNDMSKMDYAHLPEGDARRKGAFASILEAMNKEDV